MSSSPSRDELKAKLNLETSRIHWHELQTYFARGQVVRVSPEMQSFGRLSSRPGCWYRTVLVMCFTKRRVL